MGDKQPIFSELMACVSGRCFIMLLHLQLGWPTTGTRPSERMDMQTQASAEVLFEAGNDEFADGKMGCLLMLRSESLENKTKIAQSVCMREKKDENSKTLRHTD